MLLFERRRLSGLAAQRLDLFLGVAQCLFRRQHHIISPLLQLLACLVEVYAVLLKRAVDGRLGVAFRFGGEALHHGGWERMAAIHTAGAAEELLHGFLVERAARLIDTGEQQVLLAFIGIRVWGAMEPGRQ